MNKLFTSLLDYDKVKVNNSSLKRKYSFNLELQKVTPTWHLDSKRKVLKTDLERVELANGSGYTIIGDPVLDKHLDTGYFLCECNTCKFKVLTTRLCLLRNQVNCINCLNNKLTLEADSRGLELIGESITNDTNRRHYRFKECNHTRDINTGDVRSNSFICNECYSKKFESNIKELGFENLGVSHKKGTAIYYKVKYEACGHERYALQSHLATKTVSGCDICYEKELALVILNKYNIVVLDKLTETKRLIKFNDCGHSREVSLSNLKSGRVECKICQFTKFSREAEEVGLTYVRSVSAKGALSRKHLYLAECGHSLINKPAHIRAGHWTCRSCNSGYLDRPNKLYLFEITYGDFTFIKLGYSQKPEYRKYDYKLVNGSTESLIKTIDIKTGAEAIVLENSLHAKYKVYNYNASDMKQYLTESGFSECYPISLKDTLISELNEIEKGLNNNTNFGNMPFVRNNNYIGGIDNE